MTSSFFRLLVAGARASSAGRVHFEVADLRGEPRLHTLAEDRANTRHHQRKTNQVGQQARSQQHDTANQHQQSVHQLRRRLLTSCHLGLDFRENGQTLAFSEVPAPRTGQHHEQDGRRQLNSEATATSRNNSTSGIRIKRMSNLGIMIGPSPKNGLYTNG